MEVIFYIIIFIIVFLFTLVSNILYVIKSNRIAKEFTSEIGGWHKRLRNASASLLILKLAIGGFIILLLLNLGGVIFDLDLIVIFIGIASLTVTGSSFISKTDELIKEYGFNK